MKAYSYVHDKVYCVVVKPRQTSLYNSCGYHPGLLVTFFVLASPLTNNAPIIILACYQFINSLS